MLFNRNKQVTMDSDIVQEKSDVTLLILMDKKVPNIRLYMREHGIIVDDVFNTIDDARVGMLMQGGNCRLVIMETGLAEFNTSKMRVELSDLLGICDGIDKKITVFYTDTVIKSENTANRKNREVDWYRYSTTKNVIDTLKSYNENYVTNKEIAVEELPSVQEAYSCVGDKVNIIEDDKEVKVTGEDTYEGLAKIVRDGMSEPDSSIKVYSVKY